MVTKEQAVEAGMGWSGTLFHLGECRRTVGPRGGVRVTTEKWRANGKCKTWKTIPGDFRLPIKYGMYQHSYLTQENAHVFHRADECPLDREEKAHTLVIDSLDDARAHCTCGGWSYSLTGKGTEEEIKQQYEKHAG